MSITHFRLLHSTQIHYYDYITTPLPYSRRTPTQTMTTIHQQVKKGQKKWPDEIDTQNEDVDKEEINDFVEYKLLEYKAYKL